MFKLVVLFAFVAGAVAKPGYLHGTLEVAAPIIAETYSAPAAISSTYREDVISKPAAVAYAATPVIAKTIVAEPVAVAAPVLAKTVVVPAAISSTYRQDIVSKPAAVAYATPAVVAAPVVQRTIFAAPVAYAAHAAVVAPAPYSYTAKAW